MREIFKASSLVVAGNALSAGFGFVLLALLTRSLGAEGFGSLASLLNLVDLGLVVIDSLLFAGVVVTTARHAQSAPEKARMALKIGFLIRLPIAVTLAVVGLFHAETLAQVVLGTSERVGLVSMVFLALPLLTIHGFVVSALQARQMFGRMAAVALAKNAARLGLVAALLWMGRLDPGTAAVAIVVAGGLAMALALLGGRLGDLAVPGFDRTVFTEIFSVNKWMAVAAVGLLGARIDILMLTRLSGVTEAGFYAAALQLCLAITMVSSALVATLLPKAAQMTDEGAIAAHFRRCLPFVLPGCVLAGLMAWVGTWFVPLALGPGFEAVVIPFALLSASAVLTLVTNPAVMVVFSLDLVWFYAVMTLVQLALRVPANLIVMPTHGAAGAAAVDLGVKLATVALTIGVLWIRLHARPATGKVAAP